MIYADYQGRKRSSAGVRPSGLWRGLSWLQELRQAVSPVCSCIFAVRSGLVKPSPQMGRRPHRRLFFSRFALLKMRHTRNPYRLPTTTKVSALDTGHV